MEASGGTRHLGLHLSRSSARTLPSIWNTVNPANDKGPPRYVARKAVDVRELADHFNVDEDRMREFCLKHEAEISEGAHRSALEFVEEFGKLEGLVPLAGDQEADGADWDERPDRCTCDSFGCAGAHADR